MPHEGGDVSFVLRQCSLWGISAGGLINDAMSDAKYGKRRLRVFLAALVCLTLIYIKPIFWFYYKICGKHQRH